MEVTAPIDAIVTKVNIEEGKSVAKDSVAIELWSVQLDNRLLRLQNLERIRTILEDRITGDYAKTNRKLCELAVDVASKQVNYKIKVRDYLDAAFRTTGTVGVLNPGNYITGLWPAQQDAEIAMTDKQKADLQLLLFDYKMQEAINVMQIAKEHLQAEIRAVNQLREQLKVVSPQGGNAKLRCGVKSFVKRGATLFEVI